MLPANTSHAPPTAFGALGRHVFVAGGTLGHSQRSQEWLGWIWPWRHRCLAPAEAALALYMLFFPFVNHTAVGIVHASHRQSLLQYSC